MAPQVVHHASPTQHPQASTSRTSLDDLERDEAAKCGGRRRGDDKLAHPGDASPAAPPPASFKGKERDWSVELAVLAPDGGVEADRGRLDLADEAERARHSPRGRAVLDPAARTEVSVPPEQHNSSPRRAPSSDVPAPRLLPAPRLAPESASSPPPPPAPEQPARPARPPLQSILKRPDPARTASSQGRALSSTPLLALATKAEVPPLPLSPAPAIAPAPPAHAPAPGLGPPTPDSVDDDDAKDKLAVAPSAHQHTVLFSTPGTTTSVLPLSSPSHLSHHSGYTSSAADTNGGHAPNDFTGTFRSWKSSAMGRKSGIYEKKRLAELGFDEELSRDYDFFASFGIAICNIGGLPGAHPLPPSSGLVLTHIDTAPLNRYYPRRPDGPRSRRRLDVRHRVALVRPLHDVARGRPRRDGVDLARRRCHVHVGVPAVSESQGAKPVGAVRFLDRRELAAVLAHSAPGAWRVPSVTPCAPSHDCAGVAFVTAVHPLTHSYPVAQIVCTWQFAHNLLGVIGLWTETEYSYWVVVAISWVRLHAPLSNTRDAPDRRLRRSAGHRHLLRPHCLVAHFALAVVVAHLWRPHHPILRHDQHHAAHDRRRDLVRASLLPCSLRDHR